MLKPPAAALAVCLFLLLLPPARADGLEGFTEALQAAGENRAQIQAALDRVPPEHAEGLQFLVANMPPEDLRSLSADFLLENVEYAYRAWDHAPWKAQIPADIFLNDVLPYASVNERRDNWRKSFYERFMPLVEDASSPGQAAVRLNQQIFDLLHVRYSTRRARADQGPFQSIESGLASCTGLSILLIDACRAVGVPARFVGTPLWSDGSGNHSWVEVWDQGWHFTGAAEPAGDELDQAWFVDRASRATPGDPRHGIFAVSFRRTSLKFPLVWARRQHDISAVDVTARYAGRSTPLPQGMVQVRLRALLAPSRDRCSAAVVIRNGDGKILFEGRTHDERADANDHLTAVLPEGETVTIEARVDDQHAATEIPALEDGQLITIHIGETSDQPQGGESAGAVQALEAYLDGSTFDPSRIAEEPFASVPLTAEDARKAAGILWEARRRQLRQERSEEMEKREIQIGQWTMPFYYRTFGDKPDGGWSLYISLHGGGSAPAAVNDRQWENQKKLYEPSEGIYLAPRAPTNTWNMWHQDHIDDLFDRLIEDMVAFEDVNPDRVYLMGYSAGGDGVYQLAPRWADRLAAAAMMAGHPNEASPLGLRNLPFALQVGGKDSAYNRNEVARQWAERLDALHKEDPQGYVHFVKIYPDKGHWMGGLDAVALPWMAQYERQPFPDRIVWYQDDVTHDRFYWLAVSPQDARPGTTVTAERQGQEIRLTSSHPLTLRVQLSDELLDMDQPVRILAGDHVWIDQPVSRTIGHLARSLADRADQRLMFSAEVIVELPASE